MTLRYSVVLPCYNESGNLRPLVECFRRFAEQWDFELILVNNGSTDSSRAVIAGILAEPAHGFVRTIDIPKNIGYGHGIHTGLRHAAGAVLAYSHADIQTPPEDVFRAFALIRDGAVDIETTLVKGRRPGRDRERVLTRWLSRLTKLITGFSVEDINGQPKIFSRRLLDSMPRPVHDFAYDTQILYAAFCSGYRIHAFDVAFERRVFGESKWASTIWKKHSTILRYVKSLARMSWDERRRKDNPIGQALRFVLAGALTNVTNYLAFLLWLYLSSGRYVASSVTGFFAGFVVGFFVNKHYTFGRRGGHAGWQALRFLAANLLSLGANVVTIYAAVDLMGIIPQVGQVFAILVSATVNFLSMKLWVFGEA